MCFQCQSQALRFEGRALTVKQAYEPSNIYCENLDFDPKKATRRRAFTCCISFFLLIISCILLVIAKSKLESVLGSAIRNWLFSCWYTAGSSGGGK